ncbi:hypothetical protein F2Q70_00044836 [Brassica cretica]|uniref:Uncharacterized protein n=2 Tax=Brassica cretica TaxID=69181 RepID=A0A3N6SF89_BRACR|nr:hypothetical protein F2Q70_00044836 [Brassica cretica]KAF2609250.1 hypothetical protein F2Q68_00045815 [Brassica cretica]KAF3516807.1 hypothetical protein DY000_02062896 [Brassica cretica]
MQGFRGSEELAESQGTNIMHHSCCDWWEEQHLKYLSGLWALSGGMLFIIFGIQSFLSPVDPL